VSGCCVRTADVVSAPLAPAPCMFTALFQHTHGPCPVHAHPCTLTPLTRSPPSCPPLLCTLTPLTPHQAHSRGSFQEGCLQSCGLVVETCGSLGVGFKHTKGVLSSRERDTNGFFCAAVGTPHSHVPRPSLPILPLLPLPPPSSLLLLPPPSPPSRPAPRTGSSRRTPLRNGAQRGQERTRGSAAQRSGRLLPRARLPHKPGPGRSA
jgi:hypothetical protein